MMSALAVDFRDHFAVFGGTFDPPHLGHLEAIIGILKNPGVKKVLVLPSGQPPLKPLAAPAEHRLRMLELLLELPEARPYRDQISIDRTEIDQPKTSYSIDTLRTLSDKYGPKIAMVIGTDQVTQLERWKGFPELLETAHWIVLERKNQPSVEEFFEKWKSQKILRFDAQKGYMTHKTGKSIVQVPTPARSVSSTQIREQIALKKEPELPSTVISYLKMHRLYGSP